MTPFFTVLLGLGRALKEKQGGHEGIYKLGSRRSC